MRILITGGSGFLGTAFVRAATARNHQIAVLTRAIHHDAADGVTWLSGSASEPPWAKIARFTPEVCIHAAWITTPGVYLESPENHDWLRWSLDFLTRLPSYGVRQLVALGTCLEYQVTGWPMREDGTPLGPVSAYARSKVELQARLQEIFEAAHVPLAWARVFYPYGEGEHPARLMSSVLAKLRAGETVSLRTPYSTKDYIHADDVASALLALIGQQISRPVNIGTGTGVTVETIARRLAELLGRPELVLVPIAPPPDPLDFVVADVARLQALGWRSQVPLELGLRRLAISYESKMKGCELHHD